MSATLVGAAGGGLILANLVAGSQRGELAPLWSGSGDLTGAHTVVKHVGAEVVAVGALTLWAGSSSTGARAGLAILACLWVVWLIHHGTSGALGSVGTTVTQAGRGVLSNPFRVPGTVSPPVNTGPPVGRGPMNQRGQIPGLPPVR